MEMTPVGRINGQVTDADDMFSVITGVKVTLKGTNMSAMTDEDGIYTIRNVPIDTYTLIFSRVGFKDVEISQVGVHARLWSFQDVEMTSSK